MMKNYTNQPDYIFEVSWEVCNLVGGIYTVLSTKAKTLHELFGDNLIFVGPDIWKENESPYFAADNNLLKEWVKYANESGLKIRVGRWLIPGKPIVVLVDFEQYYANKNSFYGEMWELYKVNSLESYGDYDEASMFAYAAALVIENYYKYVNDAKQYVVNFNEWTTGMGLLYLKSKLPAIASVFTTHATAIGRSIAGNNKPLYDYLQFYNGDQMAAELNMVSKHSVEKTAAQIADSFTTVSEITSREASQLLERMPLVTPNGFEENFVPKGIVFDNKRKSARKHLLKVASKLIGYTPADDALLVATAGRYEYKNKGIDLFIDSINKLREEKTGKEIIAFILVPAWVSEPRYDLIRKLDDLSAPQSPLSDPIITHHLHNYNEDAILQRLHCLGFNNEKTDNVKIIYVPCYLRGDDGIFNISYYNLLIGMDVTVFPSYYEPWGYTPLESIAFGVPTITTDLSGFGMWSLEENAGSDIISGVKVIHRNDNNYWDVVNSITSILKDMSYLDPSTISIMRSNAKSLAHKAQWKNFIDNYLLAYDYAITKTKEK